jgi:hypothetical protein
VLLRLAYLGMTNVFALLRLLPMSNRDKDAEILALHHQLSVLQRQLGPGRARFTPGDRGVAGGAAAPDPEARAQAARRGTDSFRRVFAGRLMLREKHLNVTLAQAGVLRAVLAAGFYMFINAMFPDPNSSAGNYVLWWAGQSISSIRLMRASTHRRASRSPPAAATPPSH